MKKLWNQLLFALGFNHKCCYCPWEVAHAEFNVERFASDEVVCLICEKKTNLYGSVIT